MIKIAMVEDDSDLASYLIEYLSQYNIVVENFEDPYIGLSAININTYDLVILDLSLPGMDGLEVCKEILKRHDIPIIISSARSDITDKVTALELGADDYLPKPYDPRELEVRIKTILRRFDKHMQLNEQPLNEYFVLNEAKQEILKDGSYIYFTAGEYAIMSLLIKRKGFIVSREEMVEYNQDNFSADENSGSIAVIINRIRHKIEQDPKSPRHLRTIRGMGYKLVD